MPCLEGRTPSKGCEGNGIEWPGLAGSLGGHHPPTLREKKGGRLRVEAQVLVEWNIPSPAKYLFTVEMKAVRNEITYMLFFVYRVFKNMH